VGLELAEVVRRFGPGYLERHGAGLLPSHRRALDDIVRCRTAELGGHVWHCPDCDRDVYVCHGCRNRNCPSCHTGQTEDWLSARREELLPCGYFHVTTTIPEELREAFRSNQKDAYGLFMSAAANAVMTLCRDPRHLGGTPGILSVLHTWTGRMDYHPHVHLLVTAGGVSADGQSWVEAKPGFLVPGRALSRLVRRRMREALEKKRPELLQALPAGVWKKEWVANIQPWTEGPDGVLVYMARYVFRIAITNARLVSMDDTHVTFRWKDRKAGRSRVCRVTGEEFLRRYLQHALPKGFHKVRYHGLWHARNRQLAARVRQLLLAKSRRESATVEAFAEAGAPEASKETTAWPSGFERCPHCGAANLIWIGKLRRPRIRSP
jgi:hypothetical protein